MSESNHSKASLFGSEGVFAPRGCKGLYQRWHTETFPHGEVLVADTAFPKPNQTQIDLACLLKLERAVDFAATSEDDAPVFSAFEMMHVAGANLSGIVKQCVYRLLDRRIGDAEQAQILGMELNSLSILHQGVSDYIDSYAVEMVDAARKNKSHGTANALQGKLGTLHLAGYNTDKYSRLYNA